MSNNERVTKRNGIDYAHVTTIIGDVLRMKQLEQWRGRVGNQVADNKMKKGANAGTRLHKASVFIGTTTPDIPTELDPYESFLIEVLTLWHTENVEEVLGVEEMVFNDRYKYCGTLDKRIILRGDGKRVTTADLKTGAGIYPSTRMQTAAYREVTGDSKRIAIHLDQKDIGADEIETWRSGKPADRLMIVKKRIKVHKYFTPAEHKADFNAFLCCRSIYQWLKTT